MKHLLPLSIIHHRCDAAVELDYRAKEFDEGIRFPLCREGQLEALVHDADLKQVEAAPIEVTAVFQNFDEYWIPFLGNVGPALGYNMSLLKRIGVNLKINFANHYQLIMMVRFPCLSAWAVKGTA
jgi:hypothetical protein